MSEQGVRLDKWLWAARFFKTRSQASSAIDAGHVHLNGERAKPARNVKAGDSLRILNAGGEFLVTVLGLSEQRGPASVAQQLYAETEASAAARRSPRRWASLRPLPARAVRRAPGGAGCARVRRAWPAERCAAVGGFLGRVVRSVPHDGAALRGGRGPS